MTELPETPNSSTEGRCTNDIILEYPCTQLTEVHGCLLKNSALVGVVLFISTLGLIGNGTVFWLLGFRIKRNFFSVYVLNLAVADFGVLTAVWSLYICAWSYTDPDRYTSLPEVYRHLIYLFFFVQCSSIHFLTAISVDRCLVLFFPVWHRCHRPKNLSAIVSSVLWGIACIFWGMIISCWEKTNITVIIFFMIFVSVMVISTTILFFKVCCNSRIRQYERVHIAILLSLLFFIILIIPISLLVKYHHDIDGISSITLLLTCMNSSINPVIYFIFGRYRPFGQSRMSIKDALWRFFKEEEVSGNETQNYNLNSSLMSALYKIRPLGSVLSTQTGSCPQGSPVEEFHVT